MFHGPLDSSTAAGLDVLRERLERANVPSSCLDETLTVATWNTREFGRRPRSKAALHMIAEIIGQFDLVSIVELRDETGELDTVLRYLGPYWDVIYSDYNTDRAGNRKRIGFVFDRRAVVFTGLASNIHAPRRRNAQSGEYAVDGPSWWRTPYIASFRAGNFDFVLLAAHIRWGKSGKAGEAQRLPELELLANWVERRFGGSRRAMRASERDGHDLIVVGDFNIPSIESDLYRAVTRHGLRMAEALAGKHGTNLKRNKRYDQILHLPHTEHAFSGPGGVVDFYASDHRPLFPNQSLSKREFTYQISDHLPLWVQVRVDAPPYRRPGISS